MVLCGSSADCLIEKDKKIQTFFWKNSVKTADFQKKVWILFWFGYRKKSGSLDFIRHTFASRTILGWLEQDIDVNAKLYLLSTYMGHNHPEDTYWYLSATPELLVYQILNS